MVEVLFLCLIGFGFDSLIRKDREFQHRCAERCH